MPVRASLAPTRRARLAVALAPAVVTAGGWGAALGYRMPGCRGGPKD